MYTRESNARRGTVKGGTIWEGEDRTCTGNFIISWHLTSAVSASESALVHHITLYHILYHVRLVGSRNPAETALSEISNSMRPDRTSSSERRSGFVRSRFFGQTSLGEGPDCIPPTGRAICVCMYLRVCYMYIYIYIHTHTYIYTYICMYIYIYIYT